MKLPRLGDSPEDRLLEEAASIALITGERLVDLGSLKASKGLDVRQAGLSLQKRGFGQLLEIGGDGEREYHFGVRERGFEYAAEVRDSLKARTLVGRIHRINWNAVNAIAALVAAIAATLAAYFSYLAIASK